MKVHSLLTPKTWLKQQIACDKHGDIVLHPTSPRACGWCLIGAIEKVYGTNCLAQLEMIAKEVVLCLGGRDAVEVVCDWNDAPERTFDEVHRVLVKLDL